MNYKIGIDENISEQSRLIVYSIERLRLTRQVENRILYDGEGISDEIINITKNKIKREFYNMLKDFIEVEFDCGRFGINVYTAKLDLPYIKSNVMKRLENKNSNLSRLNLVLNSELNTCMAMTRWQHFKSIFKKN